MKFWEISPYKSLNPEIGVAALERDGLRPEVGKLRSSRKGLGMGWSRVHALTFTRQHRVLALKSSPEHDTLAHQQCLAERAARLITRS
jgi:hypothetical protein